MERVNATSQAQASYRVKKSMKRGCFITTAACEVMGKSDDCPELETLRHFRDVYMLADDDGKSMVQEYYEIAPAIIEKIKTDYPEGWKQIFESLFHRFITPAVQAIESGDNVKALQLYVCLYVVAKTAAWGA